MPKEAPSAQPTRRTFLAGAGMATIAAAVRWPTRASASTPTDTDKNVLNVVDYGAVPNDGNVDDAAIAAAIADAGPGSTVYFPPGVFDISASIRPKSGIRIAGASRDNTRIRMTSGGSNVLLDAGGLSNLELTGLTLDGMNTPNAVYAVAASNADHHLFHDLRIVDFADTGSYGPMAFYFSGNVSDSVVTGTVMESLGPGSTWGCGMRISSGSARNTVVGNTITNTGRGGVLLDASDSDVSDTVITNNTITGSGNGGGEGLSIEVWGGGPVCRRTIVEDNNVDHWISVSGARDTAVRRNMIDGSNAAEIKFEGLEIVAATNTIMTDNTVNGGQDLGLGISNSPLKDYAFIARNTIKDCVDIGFLLQGNTDGVKHFYIYKNHILNTTNQDDASWYDYDGTGFAVDGNAHAITLEANQIVGSARDGIRFTVEGDHDFFPGGYDQLVFIGNEIINNTGDAVGGLVEPGTDIIWRGNHVAANGTNNQLQSSGFAGPSLVARFTTSPGPRNSRSIQTTSVVTGAVDGIAGYLWDFGDGLPATEANPTHVYSRAGSFIVTLLVWDGRGLSARAERTVRID